MVGWMDDVNEWMEDVDGWLDHQERMRLANMA